MKKLLFILIAMLAATSSIVLTTSCSDETEQLGNKSFKKIIVGTWRNYQSSSSNLIEFKSDGTFKSYHHNLFDGEEGEWAVSDDLILKVKYNDRNLGECVKSHSVSIYESEDGYTMFFSDYRFWKDK